MYKKCLLGKEGGLVKNYYVN